MDKPQADDASFAGVVVVVLVDVTVATGVAEDVCGAGARGACRVASGQTDKRVRLTKIMQRPGGAPMVASFQSNLWPPKEEAN